MAPGEAIIARRLSKSFNGVQAVKEIDLAIRFRECFGFLGPNGAGKTTTVKMICCFSPPTAGELEVLGYSPVREAREIKRRLGLVPQEDNLDVELTVWENLLVYASYFGLVWSEARARASELLEFMELAGDARRPVEELSGGMKRRLTIARALINRPSLLVLDEPTTGLDPTARQLVWQRLRHLKEQGLTLILTTHYLEEASSLCDRLVIMHQGRILEEGEPAMLVAKHVGTWVLEVGIAREWRAALLDHLRPLWRGHLEVGEMLFVFFDSIELLDERLSLFGRPLSFRRVRPASLEDAFFKLTGRGLRD